MDAATITDAALETLDEVGLDRLSMRQIAARLGVQVGGLYYYVPDKTALLRSMADAICHEALGGPDGDRRTIDEPTDAAGLCRRTRKVLLARRDSARVFALSPLGGSVGALTLMERLIGLVERRTGPGRANVAADTLLSYVAGFVLQEQAQRAAAKPSAGLASSAEGLAARFPRLAAGVGLSDDDAFEAAVEAILAGFTDP